MENFVNVNLYCTQLLQMDGPNYIEQKPRSHKLDQTLRKNEDHTTITTAVNNHFQPGFPALGML